MTNRLAHFVAKASRVAPFERGRWRLGALAYSLLDPKGEGIQPSIKTRHGFSMALDLRQFIDRTIYCTGEWEPHETALIRMILRPGDEFVDVGANIGFFSLLASRIVGPTGRVHAVEANPATFDLLRANISCNGVTNISAHNVAVGEEAGHATVQSREPGNAGADFVSATGRKSHGVCVPMQRLDNILRGPTIRLIKMDIEGFEAAALRGAVTLLERDNAPDLLFELTPELLRQNGDSAEELCSWLVDLGYQLKEISSHSNASRATYIQRNIHASKL